jgi:hypothetical protein
MSQTTHEDVERGYDAGVCYLFGLSSPSLQTHINTVVDDQPHSAPIQPSQPSKGKFAFGDSSGRLFSIYSKAAKEEDDKMVERWQKDAEGILIFVSPGPWLTSVLLLE